MADGQEGVLDERRSQHQNASPSSADEERDERLAEQAEPARRSRRRSPQGNRLGERDKEQTVHNQIGRLPR